MLALEHEGDQSRQLQQQKQEEEEEDHANRRGSAITIMDDDTNDENEDEGDPWSTKEVVKDGESRQGDSPTSVGIEPVETEGTQSNYKPNRAANTSTVPPTNGMMHNYEDLFEDELDGEENGVALHDAEEEKPTQEEIADIRKLLGHLQKQVKRNQEKGKTGSEEYNVSLEAEEVKLLGQLLGRGLIRAPSRMQSSYGPSEEARELTMVGYANLVSRAQGDDTWPVNLAFRDLTYTVKVRKVDIGVTNIFKTLWKLLTPFSGVCGESKNLTDLPILRQMSGVFEAGKSTLVLGPPGCGVSTLFKALSGRLKTGMKNSLEGDIFYSGFRPDELHLRKMVTFVDQVDVHNPIMTVRETLQFSYKCFGGPEMAHHVMTRPGTSEQVSEEEWKVIKKQLEDLPQFIIDNLALTNAADTIVGNELVRGVSGGEKKRVTSAEMLMGRRPIGFYDQISTGLDSAATFDICRRITGVAKKLQLTPIIALLQPPPETYELFDEILILALGYVVFHGPREDVLPYFESIGFECPFDRDIADFIQEVTTPQRKRYQIRSDAPANEKEMADAWSNSPFSLKKRDATDRWCTPENKVDSAARRELYSSKTPLYANSFCQELKIVLQRQTQLTYRDTEFVVARLGQAVVMGVLMGTVFLDLSPDLPTNSDDDQTPATQRFGILFMVLLQAMLAGVAQIPVVLFQRPVYYKQSGSLFFRTISYVLSEVIAVLPLALAEAILLATLIFWIPTLVPWENTATGESDVGGTFMLFVVVLFVLNMSFSAWLRAVATIATSPPIAQVLAAVSIGTSILFSGYIITRNSIPTWCIWIYWLSPIAWGFRSSVLVIFGSKAFTEAQRSYALDLFGIQDNDDFIWGGILVLLGYKLFDIFLSYTGYTFVRSEGGAPQSGKEETNSAEDEAQNVQRIQLDRKADPHDQQMNPAGATKENSGAQSYRSAQRMATSLNKANFVPADLVFRDLWYSVPGPNAGRGEYNLDLLKGITGYAEAGTLTALMGSSGAGKSTLLDVLALRKTGGRITGEVLVNGHPQEKTSFSRIVGYVEQMDIHSPFATVHEALTFSAYLRQPHDVSKEDKDKFVESVIETLKLEPIRDLAIGFKTSGGLSTEQAKRVTIGVELSANPAIIFADEPTSGLDASSARIVMEGLERIARAGRTIICTIHQPSKDIFTKFDRLLLLRRGGEMVYFGDLGQGSEKLLEYLAAIPGTRLMPNPRYNPATYMLEAIGASAGYKVTADYAQEYKESELRKRNEAAIDEVVKNNLADRPDLKFNTEYASTFAVQQDQLAKRWWLAYWRNPAYNTTRFVVAIVIGLFFGSSFYKNGLHLEESTDIQSFMGLMFQGTTFMGVIALNTALPTIMDERASFYRERAAHYYGVVPMVIAQTLAEFPYIISSTLVFSAVFYNLVYLWHDAAAFFLFWIIYLIFMMTIIFWGHFLAAVSPNEQVANIIAALSIGFWAVTCGLMIAWNDIPGFWQWVVATNPIRYAMDALVASQLGCEDPSTTPASKPGCSMLSNGQTAWEYTKENFGYEAEDWKYCLGALAGYAVGLRIITMLAYQYVSYLKR